MHALISEIACFEGDFSVRFCSLTSTIIRYMKSINHDVKNLYHFII